MLLDKTLFKKMFPIALAIEQAKQRQGAVAAETIPESTEVPPQTQSESSKDITPQESDQNPKPVPEDTPLDRALLATIAFVLAKSKRNPEGKRKQTVTDYVTPVIQSTTSILPLLTEPPDVKNKIVTFKFKANPLLTQFVANETIFRNEILKLAENTDIVVFDLKNISFVERIVLDKFNSLNKSLDRAGKYLVFMNLKNYLLESLKAVKGNDFSFCNFPEEVTHTVNAKRASRYTRLH